MPTRDFTLKLKSLEPSGSFVGYASTYGNTDLQGDVIAPGAFKQAIQSQGIGYPLLFGHDQTQPLGVGKISDSSGGLVVDGALVMADPAAVRVHAHMKAGSIRGLSIGFQVPDGAGKSVTQSDGTRLLKEIRLHEISLVAIPANPRAQVTSVKSISEALGSLRPDTMPPGDRATLLAALRRLLGGSKDALCQCDCPECLAGDCADCSNGDCEDSNCGGVSSATLKDLQSLARELGGRSR
jgi:HK97 family phage prohead protease